MVFKLSRIPVLHRMKYGSDLLVFKNQYHNYGVLNIAAQS